MHPQLKKGQRWMYDDRLWKFVAEVLDPDVTQYRFSIRIVQSFNSGNGFVLGRILPNACKPEHSSEPRNWTLLEGQEAP